MIHRYLHRNANNLCHTPGCEATAKPHNKLYWHEPKEPNIHSATYCRSCYYRLTNDMPVWMSLFNSTYVEPRTHFKTLKGCVADYIANRLTHEN